MRFLVLDAYPRAGRQALRDAGGTEAGELYARLLRELVPEAGVDVGYPADADAGLPAGAALSSYDGVCWTGSSLTIHDEADVRVRRQIELAREVFRRGVPSFGSCWAAQLAVVAAGGACAENPRGREFGVARRIQLSPAGRAHPLFEGRAPVFDAFTSHRDEVTRLPPGARLLASNAFSRVQAVDVEHDGASFWAVQYHPEYDLHEVASLARIRADELVAQGTFGDADAVRRYVDALESLHVDPTRRELATRLGLTDDVLDPRRRTLELRNWIEQRVRRAARVR